MCEVITYYMFLLFQVIVCNSLCTSNNMFHAEAQDPWGLDDIHNGILTNRINYYVLTGLFNIMTCQVTRNYLTMYIIQCLVK